MASASPILEDEPINAGSEAEVDWRKKGESLLSKTERNVVDAGILLPLLSYMPIMAAMEGLESAFWNILKALGKQ